MERLKALGRGTQIMFIAAVLLIIDSFLRWQEVEFDLGPLGGGSAGVSAWDDFLGIVMGLLTIVLIARIAARLAAVDIPIPLSFATTSFVLGVLIAVFAVVKNLTDDYSTFWSYVGVGLAILVAVGAWLEVQEAGGVEHLKSQMPGSGGATAAPAAAAAAPAPPAAAPPAAAPTAAPESSAEMTGSAHAATEDAAADAADAESPSTEREV
ncbi:MAG: hypothetical protein OEW52_00785 [Thermoleophilia bacterium]|nr:hypothetical protein [Thermoleophilia bacterium]MDH5279663.1 hypothetical protein [Thermoleophilia bacterium]